MIKLLLTNSTGTFDITQFVQQVDWSGDYNNCARTLSFEMLVSATDDKVPDVTVELGNVVQFYAQNSLRFIGYIFEKQKLTSANTMSITCYDGGVYLNQSKLSVKYENSTAEEIAADVCEKMGISVGSLASTGVSITRNFLSGFSGYKIIMTAYSLASATTGNKYIARSSGGKFNVFVKKQDSETLVIKGKSNLMEASVSESISKMTNRVNIVNDEYQVTDTVEDENAIALYGVFQTFIKESETSADEAQATIDESGVSQKITIQCLGDTRSIAGKMVAVYEPFTGLWGLFYIDSDTHTWKLGQYYNKLVVNFKNIMDDSEVGQLEKETGGGSSSAEEETKAGWVYTAAYEDSSYAG